MSDTTDDPERHASACTLKEVAEAAGVSVAAVSKILNNRDGVSAASRKRVLQAVERLGYQPRRSRAGGASLTTVSLVTLGQYADNNAYYGEIIDAILEQLSQRGISVDVTIVPSSAAGDIGKSGFWKELSSTAILVGIDRPEILESLREIGCTAVLVNGMDRSMRFSSVSPDYHFGGWAATRHLLDLGHRHIVHITHPYRESVVRRLDGFRDALENAGIDFSPKRHLLDLRSPNFFSIEARDVVDQFLAQTDQRPTAFFCVSDIVAIGAIQAIQAHGLSVPGDISVIGFDGLSVGGHSTPSLSTMRIDRRQLGETAVSLLEERTKTPSMPIKRIGLGVELIRRQSTGPCGGGS